MSAISRDYGVTPPAISYIIKHTPPVSAEEAESETTEPAQPEGPPVETPVELAEQAEAAVPVEGAASEEVASEEAASEEAASEEDPAPQPAEPAERKTLRASGARSQLRIGGSRDVPTASEASEPTSVEEPAETTATAAPCEPETPEARQAAEVTPAPAGGYQDPLAKRLYDAATLCSGLVEAAAASNGVIEDPEAVSDAIHNVRRALVAIEIDMSKRERKPRPEPQDIEPAYEPVREESFASAANDDGGQFASGTVKFYRADKGFGFVTPDDGSGDVYLPSKVLDALGIDRLQKGQRVKLRRRQGAKGPEVEDLRVLAS
jgi:CspA family cold shock protein